MVDCRWRWRNDVVGLSAASRPTRWWSAGSENWCCRHPIIEFVWEFRNLFTILFYKYVIKDKFKIMVFKFINFIIELIMLEFGLSLI